jgi:hypothetical protein
MNNIIGFKRIKNDTNGNPRYVCHFLNLNTPEELASEGKDWIDIGTKYALAVKRANSIGGRKYNARAFGGGGIVFQSYSLNDTVAHINRVAGHTFDRVTII